MADSPVDAAGKLVPLIRSCADQIDAARELPRSLFEALADAGMFHLAFPRSLGGAELDLPTYVEVIEEIGKADASTGWIVNQNSIFATYAARMPRDVARAIWVDTPRAVVANTPAPTAKAIVVPGGYRVTGRQGFSTGCRHASWVASHAQIIENGQPRLENGQPLSLYLFVPVAQAELLDTWRVRGMPGTGPHPFPVNDAFVPAEPAGAVSLDHRAAMRLAATHSIRLAAQIVDTAYNAAGATAIYEDHPLQRHFQDVHVITQHLQGRLSHYELVGRHWLGLPVDETRL